MPKLKFERHVPHSAGEMLQLVADVEAYPGFVPNCDGMQVKRDRQRPTELCEARMSARLGPISQSYSSRVEVDKDSGTIRAVALDGPFHHLESIWHFQPEGSGAFVTFVIDFGFSNPLVAAVAEAAFAAKQTEVMDAFMAEAERRFG